MKMDGMIGRKVAMKMCGTMGRKVAIITSLVWTQI
jgi:hypothetical protein